jgi:indole-3-glycerol phosphate synthase
MNVPEHRPNASVPACRLDAILTVARQRVEQLRPRRRELERQAGAARPPRPFGDLLQDGAIGVIAEVKRKSPSAGSIRPDLDAAWHARAYAVGGAVAISVLTEPDHFGGSLEDLGRVAEAVSLPVLRKDFILDETQLLEARAAGAAAVLLIVRVLGPARLRALARETQDLALGALVEAHTISELEVALDAGATLLGINNRDLDSFVIDPATSEQLLPRVPRGIIAVAESGIETREDVERMAAAGADHILVGTAVARREDPAAAVRALTGVARRQRGQKG